MFGKKRIQELETLLMEIQSNSENNYKDAAKEAYQQFWNVRNKAKGKPDFRKNTCLL